MNLQQAVSNILGKEVSVEEAKNFANDQYGTLCAYNREWEEKINRGRETTLVTSYIIWADLLNGTFFNTFDKAYELAKEFLEEYPLDCEWGVDREWDEAVEEFVNKRYINGKEV